MRAFLAECGRVLVVYGLLVGVGVLAVGAAAAAHWLLSLVA